jgi:hypothetical protein
MRIWAVLLLAALFLGMPVASGYVWFNEPFTSDHSSSFDGDISQVIWNTGAGILNYTAPGGGFQYWYKGEKFTGGNYTWEDFNFWYDGSSKISYAAYGSQDICTGDPQSTGTKYILLMYTNSGLYLRRVIGGSLTTIGSSGDSWTGAVHTIDISWNQSTGSHKVYLDGNLKIDITDSGIPDPGYMGIANYPSQETPWSIDTWIYANATELATSPIAGFSCMPLITPRNGTVTCTDASTETPTAWDWYSPAQYAGGPQCITANDTRQNPVIFPMQWGYCELCEIASNGAGSDTECKGNYIYVRQP